MPEADRSQPPRQKEKPPARKKRPQGLSADLPLSEYARAVMFFHFEELLRHEAGTRLGQDIEALHDMRVATRRLRAAFDVFLPAFRLRAVKPLLGELRTVRLALGPVRDLDVFIENARRHQSAHAVDLGLLLTEWQVRRESARSQMLAYLDGPAFETFKTDFGQFLQSPGAGARVFDPQQPQPQITWQSAPWLIYQRYQHVLACEPLLPGASPEQLHDLRVRFKKFRYTLEFFREILGKPLGLAIGDLKTIQDHLGDLNDAYLSCELLKLILEKFEREAKSLPLAVRPDLGGVRAYLDFLNDRRLQLTATFPSAWEHFVRPEFRQNLALAISEL